MTLWLMNQFCKKSYTLHFNKSVNKFKSIAYDLSDDVEILITFENNILLTIPFQLHWYKVNKCINISFIDYLNLCSNFVILLIIRLYEYLDIGIPSWWKLYVSFKTFGNKIRNMNDLNFYRIYLCKFQVTLIREALTREKKSELFG